MQEIIGANDDILFDLEQIKLISQREVRLTGKQKDKLNRLPRKKQDEVKKEILTKKEQEKKTFLRIWTLELEEKVKKSDLPPEVVSQILEMTTYAKDRNMTFIYDIERKIEALREQVKEAERKKIEEAMEKDRAAMGAVTGAVVGAVMAGSVLAPYVQVRYDKEEFEKRTESYFAQKVVPELVMAAEKPIVPVEPVRTYKTKQGAVYPESQRTLEKKHKDEWMDILVQKVQKEQAAKGQKTQTAEEIRMSYENMPNMKKKLTIRALQIQNPQLAMQQKQEEKAHDQAVIAKGIERLRRKHREKEAKKTRALAKQKMREQVALKKARIGSKGPHVAERERTEKPITITKETEQKIEMPKPPVATKEDEKQLGKEKDFPKTPEGMAARTQAFREQITENKGHELLFDKGFSKFLAMARERVQSESKGLSASEDKKRQELQEKINKEAPSLFRYVHQTKGKSAA